MEESRRVGAQNYADLQGVMLQLGVVKKIRPFQKFLRKDYGGYECTAFIASV